MQQDYRSAKFQFFILNPAPERKLKLLKAEIDRSRVTQR
jgi:hypothetical protein